MEYYSQYLKLYKRFIDDIFAIWCGGPKSTLLEFLNALNSKTDRIKLTFCISESSIASLFWICFPLEIPLRTCCNFPLFKSLLTSIYTYHSSRFTLLAIRKPSLNGNLRGMLETVLSLIYFMKREKFWKRLRVRGYPFRFLLPFFREIRYSDRKKWLYKKPKKRSSLGRTIVFKTTLACGQARIKNVITTILPELDCIVCYKKTATLANLCK